VENRKSEQTMLVDILPRGLVDHLRYDLIEANKCH